MKKHESSSRDVKYACEKNTPQPQPRAERQSSEREPYAFRVDFHYARRYYNSDSGCSTNSNDEIPLGWLAIETGTMNGVTDRAIRYSAYIFSNIPDPTEVPSLAPKQRAQKAISGQLVG